MAKVRKIVKAPRGLTALVPGDIVDVVAPGFGCTPEALEKARDFLIQKGYQPRIPKNILEDHPLHSNSDEKRLQMLVQALKAKDSKAIWCLRGGYGSNRLLPALNKIKPLPPKILIGISDITSLHGFFSQKWKWPMGLHGALLDRIGKGLLPKDLEAELTDVLEGRKVEVVFDDLSGLNKAAFAKKKITAQVAGGNLTVIQGHIGTKDKFNFANKIVFFEDTGERGYRIDRMPWHLTESGAFKDVAACVFGTFIGSEEPAVDSITPRISKVPWVIERWAEEQRFPVLKGLPCGHDTVQRVLPLGTEAFLTLGNNASLKVSTGIGKTK